MLWITGLLSLAAMAAAQDGDVKKMLASMPKVDLVVNQSPVQAGSSVRFTCRIENMKPDDQRYWSKQVGAGGQENTEYISTGGSIKLPPFSDLTRYTLTNTEEGTVKFHHLDITDVSKEDSGRFFCTIILGGGGGFNHTSRNVNLDVYNDSDNITLYSNNSQTGVIKAHEVTSPAVSVKCVSVGGIPTPDVKLMMDNVDVTSNFNVSMEWRYFCPKTQGRTCTRHADRIITAYNATFRPSHLDNNKKLKCQSTIAVESGFMPKTAEATVLVEHSPRFNCSEQKARPGAMNAMVQCRVYSNPATPGNRTFWTVHVPDPVHVYEGMTIMGMTASKKSLAPDGSAFDFILTINKVDDAHFSNYMLTTSNSLGERTTTTKLNKDTSPVSGASGPVTSLFASMFLLAAVFMLH